MGAIPNRLPGFQDVETDPEAREVRARLGRRRSRRSYGLHLTEMFDAMDRGELTTLFVLGENPVQSDADAPSRQEAARRARAPRRPGHLPDSDRAHGRRRAAGVGELVRDGGHGHQQRAARAARAARRSTRPASARDDTRILVDLAAQLGHEWSYESSEEIWNELRSLAPNHAGMSYERLEELGGIQWPCYERGPARAVLPARAAVGGAAARAARGRVPRRRGLAAGRPAVGASSRSGSPPAAGSTRSTPACRPAATRRRCAGRRTLELSSSDADELGVGDGDRVRIVSRRGQVEAPVRVDRCAAAGARVHDAALPRRGGDEPADASTPRTRSPAPRSSRRPRSASSTLAPGDAATAATAAEPAAHVARPAG